MKKQIHIILLAIVFFGCFSGFKKAEAAYSVNPNQIYTYEQMVKDIKGLAAQYPDIIHYKVIGQSEYGRDLYAVSLGKGPASVFMNGSHHAREWITTNLNMYMLDQYAKLYQTGGSINGLPAKTILNQSTIWFVPMVNPDGVTLQQYGPKKFPAGDRTALLAMNKGSSDFHRWKANAKGVDLNRQYDAYWSTIKENPGKPSYENFKGYSPVSASETKAMVGFVNNLVPEMAVSYHTAGQIIFWNFHQTGAVYTRDHTYASELSRMTGYELFNPGPDPSGGGFTDWFLLHDKKPAFTIEITPYTGETSAPLSSFKQAWEQNKDVGLYIAKEGYNLYKNREGSSGEKTTAAIQSLLKSSLALRPYYSDNVKSAANLYISKTFANLYSQSSEDLKKAEKLSATLPDAYQKTADAQIQQAKDNRLKAARFIDAVKTGDVLRGDTARLNESIKDGILNDQTVSQYKALSQSLIKSEGVVSKVSGEKIRALFREKDILPAKITKESTIFEISRYLLLLEIKKMKENNASDTLIQEKMNRYDRLKTRSAEIKAEGNKLHPGKYPDLPGFEKTLQKMADEILVKSF